MKGALTLGLLLGLSAGPTCAASQDDPLYARYACQQFALKQLKAPGNAKFEALAEETVAPSKDTKWTRMADVWRATGRVGSQARFGGALVQSSYTCTVHKTPDGRWTLLDLQWTQTLP